jgi:hypothetical protein
MGWEETRWDHDQLAAHLHAHARPHAVRAKHDGPHAIVGSCDGRGAQQRDTEDDAARLQLPHRHLRRPILQLLPIDLPHTCPRMVSEETRIQGW